MQAPCRCGILPTGQSSPLSVFWHRSYPGTRAGDLAHHEAREGERSRPLPSFRQLHGITGFHINFWVDVTALSMTPEIECADCETFVAEKLREGEPVSLRSATHMKKNNDRRFFRGLDLFRDPQAYVQVTPSSV